MSTLHDMFVWAHGKLREKARLSVDLKYIISNISSTPRKRQKIWINCSKPGNHLQENKGSILERDKTYTTCLNWMKSDIYSLEEKKTARVKKESYTTLILMFRLEKGIFPSCVNLKIYASNREIMYQIKYWKLTKIIVSSARNIVSWP